MYLQLCSTVGLLLALRSAQSAPAALQQVLKVVDENNSNMTLLSDMNTMTATLNELNEPIINSDIAKDCKQLYAFGYTAAGTYTIYPAVNQPVLAQCSDGYTTLQRRSDGKESFDRTWHDYVNGFGQRNADHWIGLSAMRQLTAGRSCSLRIELLLDDHARINKGWYEMNRRDGPGRPKHVTAARFAVGPAGHYTLLAEGVSTDFQLDAYALTLGSYNNKRPFSTKDNNQSPSTSSPNCMTRHRGGWWSGDCSYMDLNGSGALGGGAEWYRSSCSAGNNVCARVKPYLLRSTHFRLQC